MQRLKLRDRRVVMPPTQISRSATSGARGASIAISLQGLDPRVVLAISVWVTRSNDNAGPREPSADIPANVFWSIYSAAFDGKGALRPMTALDGFYDREVRGAGSWGPDGILRSGDTAEVNASTPLMVVIRQADIWATVHQGLEQSIWISIEAIPSDALAEFAEDEENREAYRGLLERVRCAVPEVTPIATQAPG